MVTDLTSLLVFRSIQIFYSSLFSLDSFVFLEFVHFSLVYPICWRMNVDTTVIIPFISPFISLELVAMPPLSFLIFVIWVFFFS